MWSRHPGQRLAKLVLLLALCAAGSAGARPPDSKPAKEKSFMHRATGQFDVKAVPVDTGDAKMGMMTLDKQYHGDLNAVGLGRMLTGMTDVKGSAAYVAIERINGHLNGAEGTFLIHHTGVMAKGAQSLVIRVVPDSGTGGLAGIEGEMSIQIEEGRHRYVLDYNLAK
jgi:hypothetical protein